MWIWRVDEREGSVDVILDEVLEDEVNNDEGSSAMFLRALSVAMD
jgi:hypothetical protein